MAKDWKEIKAVQEVADLSYKMWDRGWDEANGGNISYILTDEEAAELEYTPGTGRKITLVEGIPDGVRGKYILVTATMSYFRELRDDLDHLIGIVYIPEEGDDYEVVRGLEGNSRPSSEFGSHLGVHAVRLAADPEQRVVMHNHATHVLAMQHVAPIDEKEFTLCLWRMISEGIIMLPDGIGYVPWCVCGNKEIMDKTIESMRTHRVVLWGYHGLLTTGKSMHDAFGLLELIDKICEAWLLAEAAGRKNPGISDEGLMELCEFFGVTPREGYLNV